MKQRGRSEAIRHRRDNSSDVQLKVPAASGGIVGPEQCRRTAEEELENVKPRGSFHPPWTVARLTNGGCGATPLNCDPKYGQPFTIRCPLRVFFRSDLFFFRRQHPGLPWSPSLSLSPLSVTVESAILALGGASEWPRNPSFQLFFPSSSHPLPLPLSLSL